MFSKKDKFGLLTVPRQVLLLWIFDVLCFICHVFAMPLCASVYMCLVVTCWERADFLAPLCGVSL